MSTPAEFGKDTPAADVCKYFASEIKGTTVLITGPTVGSLGFETARAIAEQGAAKLILVGRDVSKWVPSSTLMADARQAIVDSFPHVVVENVACDLADLDSVRQASQSIASSGAPIDYFIANAGVMDIPNFTLTKQGHELTLAVNYLAHFVMSETLLPSILASDKKTAVFLSSQLHAVCPVQWDDPNLVKQGYEKHKAYGQSKVAPVLLARYAAKTFGPKGLRAFSVDPGAIVTNLGRHWTVEEKIDMGKQYPGVFDEEGNVNLNHGIWKSIEAGAATTCVAAFDRSLPNGIYLDHCQAAEQTCAEFGKDPALVDKIWDWTKGLVGQ